MNPHDNGRYVTPAEAQAYADARRLLDKHVEFDDVPNPQAQFEADVELVRARLVADLQRSRRRLMIAWVVFIVAVLLWMLTMLAAAAFI